jgi:hypothetical protein
MENVGDVAAIEKRLVEELKEVFSNIRLAGQTEVKDLDRSLEILKDSSASYI